MHASEITLIPAWGLIQSLLPHCL